MRDVCGGSGDGKENVLWLWNDLIPNNTPLSTGLPVSSEKHAVVFIKGQ